MLRIFFPLSSCHFLYKLTAVMSVIHIKHDIYFNKLSGIVTWLSMLLIAIIKDCLLKFWGYSSFLFFFFSLGYIGESNTLPLTNRICNGGFWFVTKRRTRFCLLQRGKTAGGFTGKMVDSPTDSLTKASILGNTIGKGWFYWLIL